MNRDAVISECGRFRYLLTRTWEPALPALVFVMLNPSTADHTRDDPTIRKCIGFADRLEHGGIAVVNLFAFRSRDPKHLKLMGYPVGKDNDRYIRQAVQGGGQVVCAWGSNARGLPRAQRVLRMLREELQVHPYALALTTDGVPRHPLMLSYSCDLKEIP